MSFCLFPFNTPISILSLPLPVFLFHQPLPGLLKQVTLYILLFKRHTNHHHMEANGRWLHRLSPYQTRTCSRLSGKLSASEVTFTAMITTKKTPQTSGSSSLLVPHFGSLYFLSGCCFSDNFIHFFFASIYCKRDINTAKYQATQGQRSL